MSKDLIPYFRELLADIERSYGIYITVHDLRGVFASEAGDPILTRRNAHPSPYCQFGRSVQRRPGWTKRCNAYCHLFMNRFMQERNEPYIATCWKGVHEVVYPVIYNGVHVAVLFAGAFREKNGENRPDRSYPDELLQMYEALPVLTSERIEELVRLMRLMGTGMISIIEQQRVPPAQDESRRFQIEQFIQRHFHTQVSLKDLARELCLSPSRASHAVREIFDRPFKDLLLQERMKRARALLLGTPQTLDEIAEHTGFSNGYYFNRVFKDFHGVPPGQFRRTRNST